MPVYRDGGNRAEGDTVVVTGDERTLTYRPRLVALSDGTTIEHESRGGSLSAVWASDLGGRYVEVVHLGHGPGRRRAGARRARRRRRSSLGDLASDEPDGGGRPPSGPVAVDLAIGLTRPARTCSPPAASSRATSWRTFTNDCSGCCMADRHGPGSARGPETETCCPATGGSLRADGPRTPSPSAASSSRRPSPASAARSCGSSATSARSSSRTATSSARCSRSDRDS